MNNDVARFRQTFITESLELLQDMEERLLLMESGQSDTEMVNAVFRCAHSIKGGAGVFGFTQITAFTHILEALLDQMREGKIGITPQAIGLLLEAKDIVLSMVQAARDEKTLPANYGEAIAERLGAMCGVSAHAAAETKEESDNQRARYRIRFAPHRGLFTTGNEPLLILKALARMGDAQITCDTSGIPPFMEYHPEDCHLRWEIALATDQGEAAIREAFEFVEDVCDLAIETVAEVSESADTAPYPPGETAISGQTPAAAVSTGANAAAAPSASIRVDIEKVDRLVNMVGEIVITQTMLTSQTRVLPVDQFTELLRGIDELAQHTRELQEAVMMMRMQPVKSIFSRMPRMVRDVAAKLGKQIRLEMIGESTEVDKTVIEQLADPLTHMIRNSVDHGIEMPQVRVSAGKPEAGTIYLEAAHRGGRIVIEVTDDGAGINRERVLAKAKQKGIVAADAQMEPEAIDMLIFAPGFSTAETVSDISGRGVGMDVVRRNIEGIGGIVAIENRPGQGATFRVSLPLTLAILDAMIVRVAQEFYIISINSIIETMRPKPAEVRAVASSADVINVRGEFIPLIYLHEAFRIQGAEPDPSKALVVLVESGKGVCGVVVDELIGQQQVVIKSLEENVDPMPGVSGATILGDGKVALILDIAALGNQIQPQPHKLAS
jgi:two-component system chemotaxis sensor kinase CheA